ncbi:hypothetical protein [Streptomyces sp. NPDC056192]|uniref:hypothetical protein n=1 Tax=Streptomyces sp. NPDC056192 TaxID=3345743 RepID=UPI0035D86579
MLAGAGLTGLLALAKGRQEVREKGLDRAEARRSERLGHRRAAYAAFLEQSRRVLAGVSEVTDMPVSASDDDREAAWHGCGEAIDAMYGVYVAVALSGPPGFADEAEKLWWLSEQAHTRLAGVLSRREGAQSDDPIQSLFTDEDERAVLDFVAHQKRVIMLARKQLGGDEADA